MTSDSYRAGSGRRLRRRVVGRAAVASVILVPGLAIATPALAATGWPQNLAGVDARTLQTTPDGRVTTYGPSGDAVYAKTFGPDGSTISTIPRSSIYSAVVDSTGTIYGTTAPGYYGDTAISAWRNSSNIWISRLPATCPGTQTPVYLRASAPVVGADGVLYAVSSDYWNCGSVNHFYLTSIRASDGQILHQRPLDVSLTLQAYRNGLLAVQGQYAALRYFAYDGDADPLHDFAPVPISETAASVTSAINADGKVYLAFQSLCQGNAYCTPSNPNTCLTGFAAYDQSGRRFHTDLPQAATGTVAPCLAVASLATLPQGGAVMTYQGQNRLGSLSDAGMYVERPLPAIEGGREFDTTSAALPPIVSTDVNGNILLQRRYYHWTLNPTSRVFTPTWGVQFRLYDGNYLTLATVNTDDAAFGGTDASYSMAGGSSAGGRAKAQAPGRLYVALDRVLGSQSSTMLYEQDMAGLGMDYPRGVILGQPTSSPSPPPTKRNLVVLGDSVAAGEGINYGFAWNSYTQKWVRTAPTNPSWTDTTVAKGQNDQVCHQSGFAYGDYFWSENYTVYNMACTSASAMNGVLNDEVFRNSENLVTAVARYQLGGFCDGCTSPSPTYDGHNPDVVVLTLGADDIYFSDWLTNCYVGNCINANADGQVDSLISAAGDNLMLVLQAIRDHATATGHSIPHVYLTGYYNPFPDIYPTNPCDDLNPVATFSINPDEVDWLRKKLLKINGAISLDAGRFDNVTYVDIYKVMQFSATNPDHTFCSGEPWVYGASVLTPSDPKNPAPYHPTPMGQSAIFGRVLAAMRPS
jgi:lysophospholipase L1-like esterase